MVDLLFFVDGLAAWGAVRDLRKRCERSLCREIKYFYVNDLNLIERISIRARRVKKDQASSHFGLLAGQFGAAHTTQQKT
jgi:hypothetical protein